MTYKNKSALASTESLACENYLKELSSKEIIVILMAQQGLNEYKFTLSVHLQDGKARVK